MTEELMALTPEEQIPSILIHEAGHAVTAHVCGLYVQEICLSLKREVAPVPGMLVGGYTTIHDSWDKRNRRRSKLRDNEMRRSLDIAHILHLSAGYLAEQICLGMTMGSDENYVGDETLRQQFLKSAGFNFRRMLSYTDKPFVSFTGIAARSFVWRKPCSRTRNVASVAGLSSGLCAMPIRLETAMAHAFLIALLRWAERANRRGKVAIPSGLVKASELVKVVVALKCQQRRK